MKVDEQFKCKDCDNYNQCNYYHSRRETSFICKEFQNQWGFIKKLEKIRQEIYGIEEPDHDFEGFYYCFEEALKIVDKELTELRGDKLI